MDTQWMTEEEMDRMATAYLHNKIRGMLNTIITEEPDNLVVVETKTNRYLFGYIDSEDTITISIFSPDTDVYLRAPTTRFDSTYSNNRVTYFVVEDWFFTIKTEDVVEVRFSE